MPLLNTIKMLNEASHGITLRVNDDEGLLRPFGGNE